jgi:AcrR family transcriptional regulator
MGHSNRYEVGAMIHNEQVGRGRPRRPETDDRIVNATLDLIREQGTAAVNVAAVAARSGVAKTTIYRRYRDREELLRAALRPVTHHGKPPEEMPLKEKIIWVLTRARDVLATGVGPGGVAAVLTNSDPGFSSALRDSLTSALRPLQQQIAADISDGHLAAHVDADILLNLILGAYLAEQLRYGAARPQWLERTAELLTATLTPP